MVFADSPRRGHRATDSRSLRKASDSRRPRSPTAELPKASRGSRHRRCSGSPSFMPSSRESTIGRLTSNMRRGQLRRYRYLQSSVNGWKATSSVCRLRHRSPKRLATRYGIGKHWFVIQRAESCYRTTTRWNGRSGRMLLTDSTGPSQVRREALVRRPPCIRCSARLA